LVAVAIIESSPIIGWQKAVVHARAAAVRNIDVSYHRPDTRVGKGASFRAVATERKDPAPSSRQFADVGAVTGRELSTVPLRFGHRNPGAGRTAVAQRTGSHRDVAAARQRI
jgi:hypothetical protein